MSPPRTGRLADGMVITHTTPILALGANGTTGRRVASRLAARGVPVRAGSRAETPPFDWEERTWPAAVRGVGGRLRRPTTPTSSRPRHADRVRRSPRGGGGRRGAARPASGRGEEEAAQQAEEAVGPPAPRGRWCARRGSRRTSARSFRVEDLVSQRRGRAAGARDVGEPFVDVDDVADVVVAALTGDGHAGEVYEVTGPRLLRFDEAVAEIAARLGARGRVR